MSGARGPVKAVLIDLDDTIFDHSLTCRAAIAAVRRTRPFLRARSLDELWREYLRRLNETPPDVYARAISSDRARTDRWRRLAESCGQPLTESGAADLSQEYRRRYQEHRRAVPGAVELVRSLHRRFRVVVVTNNEVREQEEKIRFLGLDRAIDALVISEAVGAAKPDPVIFEAALARGGVSADQATMVGDSWANDVLGALAAGIRPVWFNRFRDPRPDPIPVAEIRAFGPAKEVVPLLASAPLPSLPPRPPAFAPRQL
jgi:HAD superfamily hydrolase (TIGR01549 family)